MTGKKRKIKICCVLFAALLLTGCGNAGKDEKENNAAALDAGGTEIVQGSEALAETEESAKVWGQMPSFTAKDLEGNTVTESVFAEKDLTVVNIWGTFCPPCIEEMPELGEWAETMPENVQIVGLIIDINGEDDTTHRDLAVAITEKAGADFTQIIANGDFVDIMKGVVGVPTTLFVDKDGNIVGEPIVGAYVDGYQAFVEDYLSGQ
ncbi:MAG: TlpA family protein disulfide reductase [Lachnospiraceae bacterium]|nr:TlpA family protein disulfide reductase [Lachnospiraceae bacterium]